MMLCKCGIRIPKRGEYEKENCVAVGGLFDGGCPVAGVLCSSSH